MCASQSEGVGARARLNVSRQKLHGVESVHRLGIWQIGRLGIVTLRERYFMKLFSLADCPL